MSSRSRSVGIRDWREAVIFLASQVSQVGTALEAQTLTIIRALGQRNASFKGTFRPFPTRSFVKAVKRRIPASPDCSDKSGGSRRCAANAEDEPTIRVWDDFV